MTTRDRIRAFILEQFYVSDPATVTDDTSLIDSGIVDSTGMLDVILFVGTTFGISIEDAETIPENLESISRITSFVTRKQSPPP